MKENIILYGIIFIVIMTFCYSKVDKIEALSNDVSTTINNVYVDNLEVITKDTGTAYIKDNNITYDINFSKPGERFIFGFDIVNPLSNKMYIRKLKVTGTDNVSFLSYTIKDEKGNIIKNDDLIDKNNKKRVYITIDYSEDYLPTEDVTIDLGLDISITM